jgi:HSP20 family molecular chaperone IbpA
MSIPIPVKFDSEAKTQDDLKYQEHRERAKQREQELLSKMKLSDFSSDKFSQMTKQHHTSSQKPNFYYEDLPDGSKKYILELDVGDFKANEVEVAVNGNSLVVRGSNEIKEGSLTSKNSFRHETMLPDHLDFKNSKSSFINDNKLSKLIFEAPVLKDNYYSRRSTLNENHQASKKEVSFQSSSTTKEESNSEHSSSTTTTKTSRTPTKRT